MVKETKHTSNKWRDIAVLLITLVVVVLVNYLGAFVFDRFDLTSEKRYTLSETTTESLETLEDIVFVRVYLEGNLPTEFRELKDATREMLDELRAYSDGKLEFEFINPSASSDEEERIEFYKTLTAQGLQYSNIRMRTDDKVSEQIIFPGAIVSYNGGETAVQLLKSQAGATQQEMIESSVQQLEYEFVSAIRKLSTKEAKSIAFIQGHGELDELESADAVASLKEFYNVELVTIDEKISALNGFDAAIIARPDTFISEKDKYIIDQFIMNGGKVLWAIDPVNATMDSLRNSNLTMGLAMEHNLTDQLFKYGVRLNSDLVLDLEALPIPIVTGMVGNQPRQDLFTWYYSPLLLGNEDHPITRSIDRMKTEFVSTLDPVELDNVSYTILLESSGQSRLVKAPTRISFNILREAPQYDLFNSGPHATAVLLEGSFTSVFENRLPKIQANKDLIFKEKSVPTKMIVLTDGDILKNEINRVEQRYYALGYYKYTDQIYGNKEFLMNAMNYLLDDSGLVNVRSKDFKIRLLDQAKIDENRYFYQIVNTALPILIVLLLGGLRIWLRHRKYAQ